MTESEFHRGDVVVCALTGDYGKPRPAVVVQSDLFNETHASLTVCPITSDRTGLTLFRVLIPASQGTGLRKDSEIMVDKITTGNRARFTRRIGRLSSAQMAQVDTSLRTWLDLPAAG